MSCSSSTEALPCRLVYDPSSLCQLKLLCLVISITLHQHELVVPVSKAKGELLQSTFGVESPTL